MVNLGPGPLVSHEESAESFLADFGPPVVWPHEGLRNKIFWLSYGQIS